MEEFSHPADKVEPDEVMVNQVDYHWVTLLFIEVEGRDEEEPDEGGGHQHRDLELVERDHRPQGVDLDKKVAQLHCEEDDGLKEEVIEEEGVDGSEDQGVDRSFECLNEDGLMTDHIGVLEEVFDQLLVVEEKPEEAADTEDDQEEEEVDHENVGEFVPEVEAEEAAALGEEVEGELLDVALVDDEAQDSVERVLAEVLRDAIVKERLEEQREHKVQQQRERQLVEEEVQVVGEESQAVRALLQEERVGVVPLLIKAALEFLVDPIDRVADASITALHQRLGERPFFEGESVHVGQEGV